MNRLFNLKASIVLFAIILCQTTLRAQSVSQVDTGRVSTVNNDTTLTKKKSSSILVKSDTALIVKAGATIVQKADTTMVINADPELIRRFNQIVAAKQQSDQRKADSAAASKQSTFTQLRADPSPVKKSDSVSSPSASVPGSVPNANTGAVATVAGAATSIVTGTGKTDASIPAQTNGTNTNNNQQASDNTGTTSAGNTTPANKPDSTATSQAVKNTTNSTVQTKTDSTAAQPNATQQNAAGSTPALKSDSALMAKVDTNLAKKDTTVKKSDTTTMKKDTALMVADTAAHVNKAKAIYLEVGGAGLAISGNYDSRFHDERNGWGYRVGLGFFSSGGNTVFTVPFQINYLTGEHSMHIEFGAGTTFLNSTGTNIGTSKFEFDKVTGFIATATIGFRFQPEHKGLNFRLAFVPILYDEGVVPAGGVSIGYTFK
jgi:hypothetical protein